MSKQKLLLQQARTYLILARLLKNNQTDNSHYIIAAKQCIRLFKAIESVERTKTVELKLVA